jgi:hypothetical protein
MKKIIINIILLGALLFVINQVIHAYFLPFTWGDEDLHTKMVHYKANKDDYTAVVVGGSLEYRHINPEIIDSICQQNGIDFRLFNAGGDGVAYLHEVRVLEEILKDPSPNLKYAFISLSSTVRFKYLNLHTKRFASWQRPQDMVRAITLTWELRLPLKEKLKYTWYYFITMIENGFNIGFLTSAIESLNHPKTVYNSVSLGDKKNGFFPYDEEEKLVFEEGTSEQKMKEMMLLSHQYYNERKSQRDSMLQQNIEEFKNYDETYVLKSMVKRYNKLIQTCEDKGIKLIVLLPPRGREPYTQLIPTFNALPDNHKINIASPIEYPEFYLPENNYNFHHLNLKGANIYTEVLAKKFLQLQGIEIQVETPENPIIPLEKEDE